MELTDLDLGPDDLDFRAGLRQVIDAEIRPRAREIDEQQRFPREALEVLAGMGVLGIGIPERFGGSEGTKLQYAIAVEEIAHACGSTSLTFMTQAHGATPVLLAGTDEQKERVLPALASCRWIGGIALTEPRAGSDVAAIGTRAERVEGGYVLRGQKMFITNGGQADVLCVFASTDPGAGARGLTAFLVETASEGVSTGKPLHKMGMRGSDTVEVFLDGVFVPDASVLGEPGDGWRIAMKTLEVARLSTAAQAAGLARGAYDIAFAYARDREQFGRPIYAFQAVQFRLVDAWTRIVTARLLTYQAARAMHADPGGRHAQSTAAAKVVASDTAMHVTTEAVGVLGGYGYMREYDVERYMRDAKVTQIYDGTNDVNRLVIARELAGEGTGP